MSQNQRPRPRLLPEEFRRLLDEFHVDLCQQNRQLVVLVWGFRFQVTARPYERTLWQRELYEFGRETAVPVTDLVPEFQQLANQRGVDQVFLDEGHGTSLTNERVGKLLAEEIARFQ